MAFQQQVFTIGTMVTAASVTPALQMPGDYLYVYLIVPTMSAGYSVGSTPLYIQCSADGVNYYRFSNPESNTLTVGANDFTVVSSTSQRVILIPSFALQYLKVEISGTATSVATQFKVCGVSNQ